MLSHRDILRDVRRALKALPDHPSACEVTRVPGAGTQTIVVRDASGRPLLTVSALDAVWAPVIQGRHQQTLDELAPRPELPAVPPLAVDPTAPGVRVLRVGDLVFAPDRATWAVGDIERTTDHGVEGEIVRLELGTRCTVVDRAEITLDTADLWECAKLPVIPASPPAKASRPVPVLRVDDDVYARDGAPWTVKAIVAGEVRLACDARVSVIAVQRETITLGEADLWYCADLPTREPRQIADTVRLWIPEGVWDGLSGDARDEFEEPLGGVRVDWQGTAGWVWARVARDEVLVTLRGLAEAHGVELSEGEETPAAPAKVAKSSKTTKRAKAAKKGGAL